jgi:uncharacterized membrane protein YdbT with pleckstrin-like domain
MPSSNRSKSPIFLLPDERIVLRANPHWLFLALPILGILAVIPFYLLFGCAFLGFFDINLVTICHIFSLFVLVFVSAVFYLDCKYNRLYLTNLRLIKERGIIGKKFMTIRLIDIEDIACKYGIWGRIFGFGNLIIESAGTFGKMDFEGMPRPKILKWMIERQMFYASLKEPDKST